MSKYNNNRERFLRVAERRTNNILKNIRLLGNCANRQSYEFGPEEVRKVFQAIDIELKRAKGLFEGAGSDSRRFTLKDQQGK
ncbi:MAG: hypothetical protein ACE5HN_00255 [Nitrospiria bacterium]